MRNSKWPRLPIDCLWSGCTRLQPLQSIRVTVTTNPSGGSGDRPGVCHGARPWVMVRYRAKAISGAGLSLSWVSPLKLRIGSASSKTHPPSRRRCRCGSCQQRSCCSNRHRYYALLGCERYAGSMRRTTAHCHQRSCAALFSTIDPTRELISTPLMWSLPVNTHSWRPL